MSADFLVVDDHPLIVDSITQQLIANSMGEVVTAATLKDAEHQLSLHSPKALIVDLALSDGDGIDFYEQCSSTNSQLRGIVFSGLLSDVDIQRAYSAGFSGILTKASSVDLLMSAVRQVVDGDTFYSPDVAPIVDSLNGGDLFTSRMIEVLGMLNEGSSNQQIASNLDISEATVSFHVNQLKTRLGARTNRQIVSQARKLGISLDSN
ncbi:response regulator transcription factor [Congregibacter brevis]|uniref:Response regulator transcription factor n=1 Tax=Congregibacter brevis TaxID=3081201 RepID=A0ABZ0IDX3_9GAMM|nr:response regulator transcription factor [Congregibacter sp. IMCC45268]